MRYKRFINKGDRFYGLIRVFNGSSFENALNNLGSDAICQIYHCDKILKGTDNSYYLVDIIEDAEIIEYINDTPKQIKNEK